MMPVPTLMSEVRLVWESLAGAPTAFVAGSVSVVVSPQSQLCPAGWIGIVVLGDSAIATAPDVESADALRRALRGTPTSSVADPAPLLGELGIVEAVGPAALAYLAAPEFRPQHGPPPTERHAANSDEVAALLAAAGVGDADESGLKHITSPVYLVREDERVVAGAGYRHWPGDVAHLSVLVAPPARGRGLARRVASATIVHALQEGRLPQWRARPPSSRRVACRLGFRVLGAQLSMRLG